jgi:hypothetical protein
VPKERVAYQMLFLSGVMSRTNYMSDYMRLIYRYPNILRIP